MRHFDQLADSVRDGLFHLAPESFDRDSERQVLANALGATLYVPATKDGLAVTVRRRAAAGTRAMVIDLEDAIADDSVETALSTTNETLRDLNENPPDSLIFVRVRSAGHIEHIAAAAGDAVVLGSSSEAS